MTRRLLIVHQSADLYGSDLACLQLAAAARRDGWQVDVLIPRWGALADRLAESGVAVHVLDPLVVRRSELRGRAALTLPYRWLRAASALRGFARAHRFDIVHSNCAPTVGGALVSRWTGAKHVWHVHEIFDMSAAVERLIECALRSADLVVAASGAVRDQFRSARLRERCRVAHTGASVPTGIRTTRPLEHPSVEIICVGRLNEWKGQDVLVDAVAELRRRDIEVHLSLVGSHYADQRQFRDRLIDQIACLDLGEHVTLLGERRDALELIGRADIAVMPSAKPEPFGIALVEAMALGRPVIATSMGGPLEIVRPGVDGLLVEPGRPGALADSIAWMIEHPDQARRMAERARFQARRFSTEHMTSTILNLYEELLPNSDLAVDRVVAVTA